MISTILTPKRRGILAVALVLFGAGIAQADEACGWWCGGGACCLQDNSGLCQPKQCFTGCSTLLSGRTSDWDVHNSCGNET